VIDRGIHKGDDAMNNKIFLAVILTSSVLVGCYSKNIPMEESIKEPLETPIEQRLEQSSKKEEKSKEEEKTILEAKEDKRSLEPKKELEKPEKVKEEPQKEVERQVYKTTDIEKSNTLSNDLKSWWFKRNTQNLPPGAQGEIDIVKYDTYYLGNTREKRIYLTFDEGYENGYTGKILDILKEHKVKAAFFVTKPYIKSQQELVKRMVEEGHIVGNHSVTHPRLPDKNKEEIEYEINETARYFKEITKTDMPLYFRPPAGEYSERTLHITKDLGYKTIFWSMAYLDWDVNNQPGKKEAFSHVALNHHNGAIILLHAVSSSNTEALGDIIEYLREQGYSFASLDEL